MRMVDICIRELGRMNETLSKQRKHVPLVDVYNDILKVFNISEKDFQSRCRDRELTIPRQIFCYVAYAHCNVILDDIAKYIGRRDHTTVLHAKNTAIKHIDNKDLIFSIFWNKYARYSDVWVKLNKY